MKSALYDADERGTTKGAEVMLPEVGKPWRQHAIGGLLVQICMESHGFPWFSVSFPSVLGVLKGARQVWGVIASLLEGDLGEASGMQARAEEAL